jgi:hypothetical protein
MNISFIHLAIIFFSLVFSGSPMLVEKKVIVKPDDLRNWINYLASDEMRGRRNGSPEMVKAANWLSEKFKEFGLKPVLNNGTYQQDYSFTSRQRDVNERNIIGVLKGNDPELKDQYIVISAHFDHVGVRKGADADSIFNGADDNAAGTCTLLGIAKTIRDAGLKPGRSIVFAAFSGEESGMRGSRFFVSHAPIPIKNIYVDINFEMTGHSEFFGKKRYYMSGCKFSDLDNMIGIYNEKSDWKLIDTIPIANFLFSASDNIAFSRISTVDKVSQGIPSGTFATATTPDYLHKPGDEGKLIDYSNMAELVRYFSDLIIWLSENKTDIQFTDPSYTRLK